MKQGDVLTVEFHGEPIGTIVVDEPYATHFFGQFHPGPGYALGQHVFDEAIRLCREVERSLAEGAASYRTFREQEDAVTRKLTASVRLSELAVEIQEFSIHHSGEVEVTFKQAIS